jgi:FtsZ-binding cell division protein ZapB
MMQAMESDEFEALEQRILRAVETVRKERALRQAAELKLVEFESTVAERLTRVESLEAEIAMLHKERDGVRQRVERLLRQLDELSI